MDNRQSWYTWLSTLTLSAILVKLFQSFCCGRNKKFFNDKVVVITGASSGIGESLAHEFYRLGCKVVLCARRKLELERVRDEILQKHSTMPVHPPIIVELDLSKTETFSNVVQHIIDVTGHIDILINNGGISCRGSVKNTSIDVFKNLMTVNYMGTVAFTKEILPHMIQRKQGHIAFMSSLQGLIAIPYRAAYSATKHALQAFGDSLRAEIAEDNIYVTVLSPGYVRTSLSINALTESGDKLGKMDSATNQGYDPSYIAEKTATAILRREKEIVIAPLLHRFVAMIRSNIPSLYFFIMSYRAKHSKDT